MTPLLNIRQAAALCNISIWTVRMKISTGQLQCVRIGTRVLIEEEELKRFVAEAKAASDPRQEGNKE